METFDFSSSCAQIRHILRSLFTRRKKMVFFLVTATNVVIEISTLGEKTTCTVLIATQVVHVRTVSMVAAPVTPAYTAKTDEPRLRAG